jgi:putative oxidoreductase
MPEHDIVMLVLRLLLGGVFLAHGVKHVINREKTIRWTASIGLRFPTMQWFFMAFAEIGIAVSLLAGFVTAIGAAGLIAMMFVAYWTVHRKAGFFVSARPDEGYEYVLTLSVIGGVVAYLGPGLYSVDDALGLTERLSGTAGLTIALAGILAGVLQLLATYRPSDTD